MGNPSVRFDEGREELVIGQGGLSIHPFPPTLLRGNRDNGEAEGSGQKDAERVKKMGAVTKFFDLRLLKVRLCADDLSFAQMAVEARRKAVRILGPLHKECTSES